MSIRPEKLFPPRLMQYRFVQHGFFFLLLALTTLAFFGLIRAFLLPLFWAVVLATLFYPLYERYRRALGGRASVAAALALLTIVFAVLVPLALVGLAVTQEAASFYGRVASGEIDVRQMLSEAQQYVPVVDEYMAQYGIEIENIRDNLSSAAVATSQFLASEALAIGQNAASFTIHLFLMLYVLFFFLRDGARLTGELVRVLPLGDERERRLLTKFTDVARATIKGTLVVGAVQGTLGGLMFWILGIPAPVFWGVIMTLLSLLPAVGAAIVWGPAALILILTGQWVEGVILIVAGTFIIGLVDNVLRPVLVSRDTQMPDFLVLIATLGGLAVFGLSGFVIGPVIAAFFLVVWDMFAEEYAVHDRVEGDPDEYGPEEHVEAERVEGSEKPLHPRPVADQRKG